MLEICNLQATWGWWSAFGVLLDFCGFGLLAYDVIQTVRSEKKAWGEVNRVRRIAFAHRYGFFAPSMEKQQEEQERFDTKLAGEETAFNQTITWRYVRVSVGIALVLLGFALQGFGAIPCP